MISGCEGFTGGGRKEKGKRKKEKGERRKEKGERSRAMPLLLTSTEFFDDFGGEVVIIFGTTGVRIVLKNGAAVTRSLCQPDILADFRFKNDGFTINCRKIISLFKKRSNVL